MLEQDSVTPTSDCSLVRRFRTGQNDAATELYARYAKRIEMLARRQMSPGLATRIDAEDVVQSVFRTFFRRAGDPLFEIPSGDQMWQFLLVIALNKVRKLGRFHRQQKRDVGRTVSASDDLYAAVSDNPEPLQILEMVLEDAMADLPEIQRKMIELRIQGFTAEEIAERTGRSSRTVERILQRFRERMQNCVEADNVS